MYKIILFYKYTKIKDPQKEMALQRGACEALGLKGRTIIAEEGINSTLEGESANVQKYIDWMNSRRGFENIHWKKSNGDGDSFPRLSVKVRNELVSLGLKKDINPNKITGKRLAPDDLKKWFDENKDFAIVDMRNDYELKVGKFENTVFPGLENFRDLKENIKLIEDLKDKTVLTVCTGGIRCEKASGFLVQEGFDDVYQLDGGIVSYMEKYPEQNFKGSLYVFDKRKVVNFAENGNHEVIGHCEKCNVKSENYINCNNPICHKHMILCEDCSTDGEYCGTDCKMKMQNSSVAQA